MKMIVSYYSYFDCSRVQNEEFNQQAPWFLCQLWLDKYQTYICRAAWEFRVRFCMSKTWFKSPSHFPADSFKVVPLVVLLYVSVVLYVAFVYMIVPHLSLFWCIRKAMLKLASVAQLDAPSDWRPGGRGFNPRRGRQHSFVEIDHEILSMVILSLPLIQERQLSVSGERMCTILVNRLED